MIDSDYLAKPGKKFRLNDVATDDTGKFKDKHEAADETEKNRAKIDELQQILYAESKHAVLIIFQAMDAGGKDGAIDFIFSGVNPQGCQVTPFKVPTTLELAHDYLWRIHQAAPPKGMIGIFNRSQYESVLVERVKEMVPKEVWKRRYDHINAFEKLLSDEGTLVLKFFLHISKKEQKKRMEARLSDPKKNWKFNPGDLKDRQRWDDFQDAYQHLIEKCSTEKAPWYVVPSDHKWYRNFVISDVIARGLGSLKPKFPKPAEGLDQIVVK